MRALLLAVAFLVGYAGRLALAVTFGVVPAADVAASAVGPTPPPVATERLPPASDVLPAQAAPRTADTQDAPPPTDAVAEPPASVDASSPAVAATPLGVPTGADAAGAALVEAFDVAASRHSARNARRPTTLAATPFRLLAYRAGDRFEVTVGDLARHYRASPRTWTMLLAAERGKGVPSTPEGGGPRDPGALSEPQCAALQAAVEEHLRAAETLRRDLWTRLRRDAADAPALDPRAVSAVFAGEHGVAVVAAGADSELDGLLDDLARAQSTVRSDVEFLLR